MALAEALEADERVTGVRYPGLPATPATRSPRGRWAGGSGWCSASSSPARSGPARSWPAAELVAEATSFGGIHTTAERRARWGTDAVSEGFIRLSAGLEDADDLIADVLRALDAASSSGTT